jgi:hypothetical protein
MENTDTRGHDIEVVECLHSTFQKLVTGQVAFELHLYVQLERIARAGKVNLDGMVDPRSTGTSGSIICGSRLAVSPRNVRRDRPAAEPGEVLQQDAGYHERDLMRSFGSRAQLASVFTSFSVIRLPS